VTESCRDGFDVERDRVNVIILWKAAVIRNDDPSMAALTEQI